MAALGFAVYQPLTSNSLVRKDFKVVLWCFSTFILSAVYVCYIEALFVGFTENRMSSLKEILDAGYVFAFTRDYDSNAVRGLIGPCGNVFGCETVFGKVDVTTLAKETEFNSFLVLEYHEYLIQV